MGRSSSTRGDFFLRSLLYEDSNSTSGSSGDGSDGRDISRPPHAPSRVCEISKYPNTRTGHVVFSRHRPKALRNVAVRPAMWRPESEWNGMGRRELFFRLTGHWERKITKTEDIVFQLLPSARIGLYSCVSWSAILGLCLMPRYRHKARFQAFPYLIPLDTNYRLQTNYRLVLLCSAVCSGHLGASMHA